MGVEIMLERRLLFVLCLLLLLLSACVSRTKYLQLEANLADTQQELETTETSA